MNTLQLQAILNDFYRSKRQRPDIEITAVNKLPFKIRDKFPQTFIVNTDPFPNPGKHWICVIFYNSSKSEYFDSLGKAPNIYKYDLQDLDRNSRNCHMVLQTIPSNGSVICGL